MKIPAYALMLLLAAQGCASTPHAPEKEKPPVPEWIKRKPADLLQTLNKLISIYWMESSSNENSLKHVSPFSEDKDGVISIKTPK